MPQSLDLIHNYPYPADLLWEVVTDLGYLEEVVAGILSFHGLPEGKIAQGQVLEVEVSLFGRLPYQPYQMEVVSMDPEAHSFRSMEIGAGVRSWEHSLKIESTEHGCRLIENIMIDAGLLTPLFRAWASFLYKKRHEPRLEILSRLEQKRAA